MLKYNIKNLIFKIWPHQNKLYFNQCSFDWRRFLFIFQMHSWNSWIRDTLSFLYAGVDLLVQFRVSPSKIHVIQNQRRPYFSPSDEMALSFKKTIPSTLKTPWWKVTEWPWHKSKMKTNFIFFRFWKYFRRAKWLSPNLK